MLPVSYGATVISEAAEQFAVAASKPYREQRPYREKQLDLKVRLRTGYDPPAVSRREAADESGGLYNEVQQQKGYRGIVGPPRSVVLQHAVFCAGAAFRRGDGGENKRPQSAERRRRKLGGGGKRYFQTAQKRMEIPRRPQLLQTVGPAYRGGGP
jgi:hypothetical protein